MNRLPLLQTRLALLGSGVDEVANLVSVVQANHQMLLSASQAVERATLRLSKVPSASALSDQLDSLERFLETQDETSPIAESLSEVLEQIRASASAVDEIRSYLTTARESIEKLNSRAVFKPGAPVEDTHPLKQAVKTGVEHTVGLIKGVERTVGNSAANATLQAGWQEFNDNVATPVDELLTQYLDLLSGIAIRERGILLAREKAGYVDELCLMTDRLVREELTRMGPSAWTMALPIRGSAGTPSWPVLRLTPAQWSIWAMPLEALEFGQLAAANVFEPKPDEAWAGLIKRYGESGLRVLVGDVFAAWSLGPAYACALVFLKADPSPASSGGPRPSDAERIALVDACLREHYPFAGKNRPSPIGYEDYFAFLDAIFNEWRNARDLLGASPLDTDAAQELSAIAKGIQDRLGVKDGFDLPNWRLATDAWTALKGETTVDPLIGIRHVVNAAWFGLHGGADGDKANRTALDVERLVMDQGRAIANPKTAVNTPDGRNTKKPGPMPGPPNAPSVQR